MNPGLSRVSPPIRRLMDWLYLASVLIFLADTFLAQLDSSWTSTEIAVVYAIRMVWVVLSTGLWLLLRRSGRRVLAVLFVIMALLAAFMDEHSLLVTAIVMTFVYFGMRMGLLLVLVAVLVWGLPVLFLPREASDLWLIVDFVLILASPSLLGFALRHHQYKVEQLREANAELSAASADLARQAGLGRDLTLATERIRTARELHDGMGQQLTAAGMSLDFSLRTLDSDPGAAWAEIGHARGVVAQARADLRSWATTTRAMPTHQFGLAGLSTVAADFGRAGLPVDLEVPQHGSLGHRHDVFVTRFVQEGLTNALRHARPDRARVRVGISDDRLVVEIRNDGRCPEGVTEGFGLRSLRNRAEELGGTFRAHGVAGEFTIRAEVPLAASPAVVD